MGVISKYKYFFFHFCAIAIIIWVTIYNIKSLNIVTILNDEFGYWSNAALIAQRPWLSLSQHTPYYSLGYSLLLIPLFWILQRTSTMYQVAIMLNCAMMVCEYCIAFRVLKKTAQSISGLARVIISFISVFLCTNLFYSQVAWSECFFTFLVWLLVYSFYKLETKISLRWLLFSAAIIILLYITHQKAIGLLIPFVVAFAILIKTHKKRMTWIIIPVLVVLIAYFIQRFVFQMQLHLVDDYRVTKMNDLVVGNDTISMYLNKIISNIVSLLISICGKVSVLFFSTWGMALVLGVNWCSTTINIIKNNRSFPKLYAAETFIALSMVIMLGLQSVQMMEDARKDVVVYSRYFDFIFGPVIFFSTHYLFRKKRNFNILTVGLVISVIGLIIVEKFSWSQSSESFNVPCSPLLGGIECWFGGVSNVVIVLIWILVIFFLLSYSTKKVDGRVFVTVIVSLFVFVNVGSAYYANNWLNTARDVFKNKTNSMIEIIDAYDNPTIVYLCNIDTDLYCADMKFLQFVMDQTEIIVKDDEAELLGLNDFILIVNKNDSNDYVVIQSSSIELIGSTAEYNLYYIDGEYSVI